MNDKLELLLLSVETTIGEDPQIAKAVRQAVDEQNSKVPNIQLQEITDSETPADIDIKTNSKAPQVAHSTIHTTDGHTILDRKNINYIIMP